MSERPITNSDDIIDSREIIERIEELSAYYENALDREDEELELEALRELAKQGEDYAEDWAYGVTLVRDSYFQRYAEELADDIGAVPADVSWPLTCIDWAQAARELQHDYSAVDFGGVRYWVR